jgi:hypothetical protein
VSNKGVEIHFDVTIKTGTGGMLLCTRIASNKLTLDAVATLAQTQPGTKMSLMKAHRLFGHPNEDLTRNISTGLGIVITRDKVLVCEDCSIAKAKQKNLPGNESAVAITERGQLFHLDMSSVKPPRGCVLTQPNFWLIVNSFTRMEFYRKSCKEIQYA